MPKATKRARELDALAKKLKLTRQLRALAEYLVAHPSARYEDAGRAAGYKGKPATLKVTVCNALKKASVIAYMDALRAATGVPTDVERTEAALITKERVEQELSLLAFSDLYHYETDIHGRVTLAPDAPKGAQRAIKKLKRRTTIDRIGNVVHDIEIELHEKPGMVKLAGRHVGMFPNKVEVTGPNGGAIPVTRIVREVVDPAEDGKAS